MMGTLLLAETHLRLQEHVGLQTLIQMLNPIVCLFWEPNQARGEPNSHHCCSERLGSELLKEVKHITTTAFNPSRFGCVGAAVISLPL